MKTVLYLEALTLSFKLTRLNCTNPVFRLTFQSLVILMIISACLLYIIYSRLLPGRTSASSKGKYKTFMDMGSDVPIFTNDRKGSIQTESESKQVNYEPNMVKVSTQTISLSREIDNVVFNEPSGVEYDYKQCDEMKFLVFMCLKKQMCGGWGDRQKGIISTYLLSVLTNRTFAIYYTSPCNLSQFLLPNSYNWTKCLDYIVSVPKSETKVINMMGGGESFKDSLQNIDLENPFESNVVFIHTNQIWNKYILAHPNASERLPWAVGKTVAEVSSLVLDRLFQPGASLQKEITRFISNVSHKQMICSHIRVGKNPTIPKDNERHFCVPNVTAALEFLRRFEVPSKYVIYVATDSEEIRNNVKETFVNAFTVDMPVIHIDRYTNAQDSIACNGLFTVLLEQYILSKCDTLLLTRSNFGAMAAYMSTKVQDLFIFYNRNNSIVKINTRSDIQEYYQYV